VITVGSNIDSMRALRGLSSSTSQLRLLQTRLSSGLRINRGSDDAAGLSIADSLRADGKIYNQAIINANDGISMLEIAEGALRELSSIVTRISELAEQSANGVYSDSQRSALSKESNSLKDEFNRIVASTEFNGTKLLSISGTTDIQVGLTSAAASQISVTSGLISQVVGTGEFQAETDLNATGNQVAISNGDFNGDAFTDIALIGSGALTILLNNGDGTFKASTSYTGGGGYAYYQELTIGDVNGDGVLDALTTGTYTDNVQVFLGNSNGSFQAVRNYSAVTTGVTNDIELADVNGDGKKDIITTDYGSSIQILLGNGDGSFKTMYSFSTSGTTQLASGDINNDGLIDIVSNGRTYLGLGGGAFATGSTYTTPGGARDTTLIDLNGDGFLDMAGVSTPTFAYRLGNGDGSFKASISYSTAAQSSNDYQLTIADLNGDDRPDVIVAENGTDSVGVFLNNGNGTFAARTSLGAPTGAGFVGDQTTVADFNGDGVPDIAVAESSTVGMLFAIASTSSSISGLDISTQSSARQSLTTARNILNNLSSAAGRLGADQSRLTAALSTLRTAKENLKDSESRIRDVDVAEESAQLVRLKLLQQMGVAVLSQSNQQPAIAINLLSI
jgi:flagellin